MLKKVCFITLLSFSFAQAQEHKPYTPTAFPDRLIMGYQGSVATSQSVNWRTDSTVSKSVAAIVEADASPDMVAKAQTIDAHTQKVVLEGKTVHYHSAHFKNLKPATQYAYRVGDGTHWSEWFHFTTAQSKPAPFSFLYFGDAQNDIRSLWSRAIRGAYAKLPNVQLILHAGDLINSSNTDWQWGEWFEAGGWINGMIPTLAVPGNHEYFKMEDGNRRVSYHWRPSFVLPENGPQGLTETAYYLDYQGTRFISLDSQGALLDSSVLDKQASWLLDVLKNNPNRWTIVMHHHPVYSTSKGRDNDEWRDRMEPIYRKHGVDLVLQGHDHTYGRGLNMPLGKSRKQPDGPIYVVSVSGPKMYEIGLQNWMDRAASNIQLFQTIQVSQDTLKYQSYAVTGEKYDAFELIKNAKGKNRLVDHDPELPAERLEMPAEYQKRHTPQQKEEYRNRFQEYKARKEAELKKTSNR